MAAKRKRENIENIPPPKSKKHKPEKENIEPRRVLRSFRKTSSTPTLFDREEPSARTKRKLQNSERAPKQQSKRQRLDDRLSTYPEKVLVNILARLKPEDKCMKPLSETCRRLKRFCEPRINVLSVDFDRIAASGEYPNVIRSYEEIRLFAEEIPEEPLSVQRIFSPSRNAALKLCIGEEGSSCKMTLRTLLFILSCFPHLQELHLLNVSVISQPGTIEDTAFPELRNLSRLTLCNCTGEAFFTAFRHMRNLEELHIEGVFQEDQAFNTLIASQRSLYSLMSNTNAMQLDNNSLPQLEIFKISDKLLSKESRLPGKVFDVAPNVRHIRLLGRSASRFLFPSDSLLMNSTSSQLRSIQTTMDSPADFNINRILENYPSLILFKSANFECRQTHFV